MRGEGVWLLTKRRRPVPSGNHAAVIVAWSRATLSEWAHQLESVGKGDVSTSRHIRNLQREVRLIYYSFTAPEAASFTIEVSEWARQDRRDESPIPDAGMRVRGSSQLDAILDYARTVERYLALTEDSRRRQYFKLSEQADIDVDFSRLHAWDLANPILKEVRDLERRLSKAYGRLPHVLHDAVHVGVPVTAIASTVDRSRQWVYETESRFANDPKPVNLQRLLIDMKRRLPILRQTMVSPDVLPVVYADDSDIRTIIGFMADAQFDVTARTQSHHVVIRAQSGECNSRTELDACDKRSTIIRQQLSAVADRIVRDGGMLAVESIAGAKARLVIELQLRTSPPTTQQV